MKGFHVAFTCAALIAISSCGTGRTQVEPPPGRDIIDLLNEKKIEVLTQGSGIQSVNLRIRNLVAEPVTVMLPSRSARSELAFGQWGGAEHGCNPRKQHRTR